MNSGSLEDKLKAKPPRSAICRRGGFLFLEDLFCDLFCREAVIGCWAKVPGL